MFTSFKKMIQPIEFKIEKEKKIQIFTARKLNKIKPATDIYIAQRCANRQIIVLERQQQL